MVHRFRWPWLPAMLLAALPAAHAQRVDMTAPAYAGVIWIDIEDEPTLLRRAQPIPGWPHWLHADDFAAQAFAGKPLYIGVRIRVAADDTIVGCASRGAGNDMTYLPRICDLLKQRAHFLHALTLDGKPAAGDVSLTIELTHRVVDAGPPPPRPPGIAIPGGIWKDARPRDGQMLGDIPRGLPNRHPVAVLDISVAGVVTRCVMRESSGTDAGDIALCTALRTTPFAPAQGEKGDPMPQSGRVMEMTLGA